MMVSSCLIRAFLSLSRERDSLYSKVGFVKDGDDIIQVMLRRMNKW